MKLFSPNKLRFLGRLPKSYTVALNLSLLVLLSSCTIPVVNKEINFPTLPRFIPFLGRERPLQPITLTYWGLWENAEIMQPLITEYQRLNPHVTINYEMRDPKEHFETVRSRIITEVTPDIIRVHATWVPFLLQSLSAIPNQIFDKTTYEQTFYPVTQDTLLFEGKYYGIPLMIEGLALVYNQDLLNEAGLGNPPPTWDVFREYVRKLTKKDAQNNITQAGVALGNARNIDHFSDILGLMFAQNGVKFTNEAGEVNFHQSFSVDGRNLGAEALTFYTLFGLSEKSWNPSWENSTRAFAKGKVAMVLVPSFRILDILGENPRINLKVASPPQLPSTDPTRQTAVNWATYWVEVVPQKSSQQKEAWQFLKFLSSPENLTEFYKTASKLRPFGEAYPRREMVSSLSTDQYTRTYVQQGESYTSWYLADATHDRILNDQIIQVMRDAVEQVLAGGAPEDALSTAASKVQPILDGLK